jgi:hypothetical protein
MNECVWTQFQSTPGTNKKGGKEKFLCVEDHPTFFLFSKVRGQKRQKLPFGDFHIKFEQKSTGAFVFYFYSYYSQKCSKREIEEEEALNTKRNAHRVCFIRMLYRYPRE